MAGGIAAEVKSRLNIVDVVGESVQLKKAGTTYKGLCPFHGEKTPSFTVTPSRDSWKCFGCGLGGDVFSFVMQRDSVPFPEALRTLANKAGVEIDEATDRLKQRGLAAAGWAEKRDEFIAADIEVDAIKGRDFPALGRRKGFGGRDQPHDRISHKPSPKMLPN